ncbi:MAG: acyl-CoA dehydrogenase family protein [Dehalococcoidia bacterium]|nr:acyl-CoA dehydrogenase family protein [Dehalococcoidia bacterium]
MDWADTPEQAAFRREVRDFIRERFPQGYPPDLEAEQSVEPEDIPGYNWPADRISDDPVRRAAAQEWGAALAERGWVAPHWPREYGGGGLGVLEQFIYNEEMANARVPMVGGIGVSLIGPTLIVYGSAEQKSEHLPRILSGEVAWAQGFSEPGAGSDLAALATRADRDGDTYVINGQKIWTSGAQYADWMCALVRTDPHAETKHRGITFLIFDTETRGISVRPLTDMTGQEPFNEAFFEDVRVPASQRVGEENRGWYVAMAMLDFERSGIGGAVGYRKALEDLIEVVGRCASDDGAGGRSAGDGGAEERGDASAAVRSDWRNTVRLEMSDRFIETEVLHNFALRTVSMQAHEVIPNYEASVNKLFGSEVHQALARTGTKAFGLYGGIWDRATAPLDAFFVRDYVGSVAHTVFSGSSEIQRNVIATRGLGLPRG